MVGKNAEFNSDVNMDIGQTVHVGTWHADGTTSVKYRGAVWAAQLQEGQEVSSSGAGMYSVEQVIGSRLILKKV
jgi:hypothetical protein